jgi:hypothetical protein
MAKTSWMYSCHEASRMISDALERKLVPTEWMRLRMHLAFCKMCRAYEQNIQLLESTLDKLSDLDIQSDQLSDAEKTLIRSNLKAMIQDSSDSAPQP